MKSEKLKLAVVTTVCNIFMANVKHKKIFWVYLLIYDFEGGAIFTTGAFFFIERYPHVGAFLVNNC